MKMLEKPSNYQEAKKIIEDAIDDDLQTKKMRIAKLRSLLVVSLGVGAAVSVGVLTENPTLGAIALPNAMMLAAPFTIPYFLRKSTNKRIKNGTYFEDKSEAQIMDAAEDYVREYNAYEEKKRSR